jgi:hypothetical protein
MTLTDYPINFVLIALVILQIRGSRLDLKTAIRPVIVVAAAALYYLRGFPTGGNDALFYVALGGIGIVLGVACGATTRVWRASDGFAYAKAGGIAAALWVIAVVVLVSLTAKPGIGLSGRHLALAICLAVFLIEMAAWPTLRFGGVAARVTELTIMGASAVAIVVFQPNGVSQLPGSAVVFIAGSCTTFSPTRCPGCRSSLRWCASSRPGTMPRRSRAAPSTGRPNWPSRGSPRRAARWARSAAMTSSALTSRRSWSPTSAGTST